MNNTVNIVSPKQLNSLKIFMNSILYLFPCETCNKKIVYANKVSRQKKLILGNIKSIIHMKKWYSILKINTLHK